MNAFQLFHARYLSRKPIPYTPKVIGYAPFTQKIIDEQYPIYLDRKLKKHTGAAVITNRQITFSSNGNHQCKSEEYIGINPQHLSWSAYSLEHEAVHISQSNANKNSEFIYTPFDHISISRLTELEAYTRHNYKLFHDYLSGYAVEKTLYSKKSENDITPNMFLSVIMPDYPVDNKKNFKKTLQLFYQKQELPPEKDILASVMIKMSENKDFLNNITSEMINRLSSANYDLKFALEHKITHILPACSFDQKLDDTNMNKLINRDGTDYFENVSTEQKQQFMTNLKDISPKLLPYIEKHSQTIRAYTS
jgi:uncharacterized protein YheU (UPF0270 family)